jgi:hypothetical protein
MRLLLDLHIHASELSQKAELSWQTSSKQSGMEVVLVQLSAFRFRSPSLFLTLCPPMTIICSRRVSASEQTLPLPSELIRSWTRVTARLLSKGGPGPNAWNVLDHAMEVVDSHPTTTAWTFVAPSNMMMN